MTISDIIYDLKMQFFIVWERQKTSKVKHLFDLQSSHLSIYHAGMALPAEETKGMVSYKGIVFLLCSCAL